uniref:Hypothetical chloroplast RF1 n=1 Tax=Prasiolopsis wulf-kochii TaxID=3239232 RepID=A0A097KK08_9CHLO|nr:hypothetical chloroplast RF1 [Prasiolopsis sp. SAG 84.81]
MASIFPLFVPVIRDYIDVLNTAYDSISTNNNLQQILQQSVVYFASSIKFVIIYFFSFQWIQDLSYLPIVIPQIKLEILKEHFFLETPKSNFFTFLETPSYTYNKFFLGFANSFFLCLPLSVAHIISVRRLLIQGLAAGISSSFGTVCGQILVFICILFGGRFFITPWFNFQILNYFLGIILVGNLFYDMVTERSIRIINSYDRMVLMRIFFINFFLAWTEQSCIFQYFGNLTFGAEPSIIEIFSSTSSLQSVLVHINYILGIVVGSFLFTSLFILTTLKLHDLSVRFVSILYSTWIRRLNFSLIIVILAFTFTSIPFYSLEYLVLSNLGFSPQDKSFKNTNTLFSYTKINDINRPLLGQQSAPYIGKKPGILTDINRFNKGRYLMFDAHDSFEQLNYRGEYSWLIRKFRAPSLTLSISRSPILSKVSKFFATDKFNKRGNRKNFANTDNSDNALKYDNTISTDIDKKNVEKKFFSSRNETEDIISQSFENLINQSASRRPFVFEKNRLSNLEKNFKQKYYSNPIYKLLLRADIDFFLSRQPTSFLLSPKEEHDLFKKRTVLANYYDSLRYYNQLPNASEFQYFFNGSKSYADRIYNHQFNGTLRIVRRLFSININSTDQSLSANDQKQNTQKPIQKKFLEKDSENFVLKFDQPLYKKVNARNYLSSSVPSKEKANLTKENTESVTNSTRTYVSSQEPVFHSFFHEELNENPMFCGPKPSEAGLGKTAESGGQKSTPNSNNASSLLDSGPKDLGPTDPRLLTKNEIRQVLQNTENYPSKPLARTLSLGSFGPKSGEPSEARNKPNEVSLAKQPSYGPFIELVNPMPFYVGWDEQLRKLVITNRVSPNYFAGECIKFPGAINRFLTFGANEDLGIRKTKQSEGASENYTNQYLTLNKLIKKNKIINFTAWPISKLHHPENKNQTSYNLLFGSLTDSENNFKFQQLIRDDIELQTLLLNNNPELLIIYGELSSVPINILANGERGNEKIAQGEFQDIIPYRGGFTWPGHSDLKFKFKNPVKSLGLLRSSNPKNDILQRKK